MAQLNVFRVSHGKSNQDNLVVSVYDSHRLLTQQNVQLLTNRAHLESVDNERIVIRSTYEPRRGERHRYYEFLYIFTREGDRDAGFTDLLTALAGQRMLLIRQGQMSSPAAAAVEELFRKVSSGVPI